MDGLAIQDSKFYKLCRHLQIEDLDFKNKDVDQDLFNKVKDLIAKERPVSHQTVKPNIDIAIFYTTEDQGIECINTYLASRFYGLEESSTKVNVDDIYDDCCDAFPDLDFSFSPLSVIFLCITSILKKFARKTQDFIPWEPYSHKDADELFDLFAVLTVAYGNPEQITVVVGDLPDTKFGLYGIWAKKRETINASQSLS